ncbi:MAG: RAD55 family ATPase [Methanosarcinales archaeon]
MVNKIDTGICGLNEMLNGGIPEKGIVVVIGPTGSGKTIMSLQFLYSNLQAGRNCFYISSMHDENILKKNSLQYGWDLQSFIDQGLLNLQMIEPFKMEAHVLESHLISDYLDKLPKSIRDHKVDILIIDSISDFMMLCNTEIERRGRLLSMFQEIRSNKSTAFITAESELVESEDTRGGVLKNLADGLIRLQRIQSDDFSEIIHVIQIVKMRWMKHSRSIRQYDITEKGIEVHSTYSVSMMLGR